MGGGQCERGSISGGTGMKKRDERDKRIKKEIKELLDRGYLLKEAILILSEKYVLTSRTIRNIWYK